MDYVPIHEDLRDGPLKKRRCTDLLCLAVFLAFLCAVVGVSIVGFMNGDPELLIYPHDSSGNQCGRPNRATHNYDYLYYPDPEDDDDQKVCVKSCPDDYDSELDCYPNAYVPTCPKPYPTNSFIKRFCIPNKSDYSDLDDAYDTVSDKIKDGNLYEWVGDILHCWTAIMAVLAISIGISFIYMVFLRYCAGCTLWLTVLGVVLLLTGFGIYVLYEADHKYDDRARSDTRKSMRIIGILILCSVAVFLFFLLFMFRRIQLAIAIMKTASMFLRDVPSVLFAPLAVFAVSFGVYIYWTFALVYIYSSGSIEHKNSSSDYAKYDWDDSTRNSFYFEFLSILWINAFKVAFTQFVIASAASYWYFDQNRNAGKHYVLRSVGAALRYHLGSLAFGSFVLALVKLVKGCLHYLQAKVYQEGLHSNPCLKFLCCCVGCYVNCFERFIKFLDKNAYIRIALTGEGFCTAARHAFTMILSNAARFAALGSVGDIFVFLGKCLITTSSTWIGFLLVTRVDHYSDRIVSPVPITLVFGLVSYVVSSVFMSVFEMACDTIIQAFLVDEHLHSKDNPVFAPEPLKKFMAEHRSKEDSTCCGCL
jgi:flagellar biosynthesis protein FliP